MAKSALGSVASIPHAEKYPGYFGIIISLTPNSCPNIEACIGPPPPPAIMTKSLGSYPL